MSLIKRIKHRFNSFQISTKITLGYAACFAMLLLIINAVAWVGVMNALFDPAENALNRSMIRVAQVLENLNANHDSLHADLLENELSLGVVLRVVTDDGVVVVDTDKDYPSNEDFNSGILAEQPSFAEDYLEVSQFKNALIYRGTMYFKPDDDDGATLYFFKTITSELKTFNELENILIGLDVFGMIFALFVGYFLSRKTLTPIKEMNEVAREIVFENMDGRIPISDAKDELTKLGTTLNEMLDRLQKPIKSQQKFVSYASHELRTPATVFLGYVELLENGGADDPEFLKEAMEALRSEANNLQKLLETISFLSRYDQSRLKLDKETLDLDEIVGDVMRKMKISVKTHTIELLNNTPAKIFGDATAVQQMIRVFLENAVKYTPAGGNVKVNSVRDGDKVLLSIADSGIGIAPENQQKIFERYFRVSNQNYKAQGSGLGLAMAKAIADLHDVEILVDSELGKGTTFTLVIPVATGD